MEYKKDKEQIKERIKKIIEIRNDLEYACVSDNFNLGENTKDAIDELVYSINNFLEKI